MVKNFASKKGLKMRFSMVKNEKTHQNLTSQNWCPFGRRTSPSVLKNSSPYRRPQPPQAETFFM